MLVGKVQRQRDNLVMSGILFKTLGKSFGKAIVWGVMLKRLWKKTTIQLSLDQGKINQIDKDYKYLIIHPSYLVTTNKLFSPNSKY